jgi:hypothetical protein
VCLCRVDLSVLQGSQPLSTCTQDRDAKGEQEKNGVYLRVITICRYIFLRFWLKMCFASTKCCNLYAEMVQG